MAIQLTDAPVIKINGEVLEGYYFLEFTMTKRLMEPNRFDFVLRKEGLTLTQDEFRFELREKLLGALVECSVEGRRLDSNGDEQIDHVDNFFRGYIQNVKVERTSLRAPMSVRCTAFSPDARLKQFPGCTSRVDETLKDYVEFILSGPTDEPRKFDKDGGKYSNWTPMKKSVNPRMKDVMPYTVQYHESGYDFIKRLAKRYGEFFYYEDGEVVFGEMKEKDALTLYTGLDIEHYDYELNMNHHTGIVLTDFDYIICRNYCAGIEKGDAHNWINPAEPTHAMAKSAYKHSTEFFNDDKNAVSDTPTSRIIDEEFSKSICAGWEEKDQKNIAASEIDVWARDQRRVLEGYVMADTLLCNGASRRVNLKLGSIITIVDETNPEDGASDQVQHEPLKVIDLTYRWDREKSRYMENSFKAIPKDSAVPPYLERDKDGFLVYGDFDLYPKSGPQHARVLDNKDPLGIGRVKVVMQWQWQYEHCDTQIGGFEEVIHQYTPWIRVNQPYGGYHRGSYFVPEIGDEVIVGFEHNNVERPYVIGSVHNYYVDEPVKEWIEKDAVENNEFKAFRTRNGHTIEVRDKGEHGYIKIYDENTKNYVVTYDTDKKLIRLESAGDIELEASHNIVLHAGNNVVVKADNDVETSAGNDIKSNAKHDFKSNADNDIKHNAGNDVSSHSGNDTIQTSDKDMVLNTEENMFVQAGKDFEQTVHENGNVSFGKDYTMEIEGNATQKVTKNLEISADKIVEKATNDFSEYASSHSINAQKDIKVNATTSIEIKALTIKEN